jgi:hypothetical protein
MRTSDILPLSSEYKGQQMWVGKKVLLFSNAESQNFFVINKNNGKLISVVSRNILGQIVRKCYELYNSFLCLSNKNIFFFSDKNIQTINYNGELVFIDDNKVYIVKGKTIYVAKDLFLSIIEPLLVLEKAVKLEELAETQKYLFVKTTKKGNCYVEIYHKK